MKRRFPALRIQSDLRGFRFQEIRSFIDHSRSGIAAIWSKFTNDFDARTAGWPEDQVDKYVDSIYDDLAMMRDQAPQLLRQAQCVIIYGTFENAIVDICRAAHMDGKIATAPPNKMNMDGVKKYLIPHVRLVPKPFAEDWEWLHDFRVIRNWIAHNGGRAEESGTNRTKAEVFASRNAGLIKFGRFGDLSLEDQFVDRACEKADGALATLEEAVCAPL